MQAQGNLIQATGGTRAKTAHQRSPKWGRDGPAPVSLLCSLRVGVPQGQHGFSTTLKWILKQQSAHCPPSRKFSLKESSKWPLPLATRVGQEKFCIHNKRQNIEEGRDLGPSSSRSGKIMATTGHSKVRSRLQVGPEGKAPTPTQGPILTLVSGSVTVNTVGCSSLQAFLSWFR